LPEYFYIKKRDPNAPNTGAMRFMHGVNRTSFFHVLLAIIVLIIKMLFFKKPLGEVGRAVGGTEISGYYALYIG